MSVLEVPGYSPCRYTWLSCVGIAYSVERLATGWKVRGSNPGGWGDKFPLSSRPTLGHTHPPIQWVKVKVTLEQATKAQRGSRGIAILFL